VTTTPTTTPAGPGQVPEPAGATPYRATAAVPAWVLAAALAVAAASVLPLVVIGVQAARSDTGAALDFLLRPRVAELLTNTVTLIACSGVACLVLGVGAAWLVERTSLPFAGLWRVLLVAPLAVPAFVNSYAWISLRPTTDGLTGAVLVTTLSYFPFVFLPVGAALRGLDPALEESARSLGLGPWRVFARVVAPQLRPAVLGGVLLVCLHLLAEFGALQMLRFPTFTTSVLEQYDAGFTSSASDLLACVLVLLCLTLLGAELLLRGGARYARLGPGARRRAAPVRLRRWTPAALGGTGVLVALALGVPLAAVVRWLGAGAGWDPAAVASSGVQTLSLAAAGAALTTAAAFPVAWLVDRRRDRIGLVVERVTYVASSLPGVVVGLALVTLAVRGAPVLYQTSALLVAAYAILFLPRAVVNIRSAVAQAPPELSDAARALGAGPWRAATRVLLPLTLPGTLAGFAMVFIAVSTELTATLLLAPTGTRTLATGFWSASDSLDYAAAAPYAAAMILLSAPMTYVLLRRPGAEAER
jgi:iron(III) transport system permease protein